MDDCLGYPHDYGNPHINHWLEPPCVPRAKMASGTSNGQCWFNKFEIWIILLQIIYVYTMVFFSLWLAIYTVRGFPMARPKGKFLQRHLAVDHPRCGTNLDTIADWLRVDQASRDGRLTRRTCVNLHHKWNPGASAKRASKQYIFQYMYAYRGRKWVS